MLVMQDVTFAYPRKGFQDLTVLKNITVSFQRGKLYTIQGPSGAGKTTLLSLLGGLEAPKTGVVSLDGKDIKTIGGEVLRGHYVSYIFQDYCLFPYMTALENVVLVMRDRSVSKKEKVQKAEEFLGQMGIQPTEMVRKVRQLSGGQQQRVAIARCLASGADYLLADEPTGNLDPENAAAVCRIFETLVKEQGKCVVVVTHAQLFDSLADQRILLQGGEIEVEEE